MTPPRTSRPSRLGCGGHGKDEMMDLREYILQRCEELRRQRLKPALQEPIIVGLIRLLPPVGGPFPKREKWLKAMDATLAMLYPEK